MPVPGLGIGKPRPWSRHSSISSNFIKQPCWIIVLNLKHLIFIKIPDLRADGHETPGPKSDPVSNTNKFSSSSYQLLATQGPARYGKLELPHGIVETPVFMPGSFI